MTLQRIPSEFPYLWGKFSFLFYQCVGHVSYTIFTNSVCLFMVDDWEGCKVGQVLRVVCSPAIYRELFCWVFVSWEVVEQWGLEYLIPLVSSIRLEAYTWALNIVQNRQWDLSDPSSTTQWVRHISNHLEVLWIRIRIPANFM